MAWMPQLLGFNLVRFDRLRSHNINRMWITYLEYSNINSHCLKFFSHVRLSLITFQNSRNKLVTWMKMEGITLLSSYLEAEKSLTLFLRQFTNKASWQKRIKWFSSRLSVEKKNTPCFHKSLSWFWILDEEPQAVTLWNREWVQSNSLANYCVSQYAGRATSQILTFLCSSAER